jgi:hypothetical protein
MVSLLGAGHVGGVVLSLNRCLIKLKQREKDV